MTADRTVTATRAAFTSPRGNGLQGITPSATGWMNQQRCAEADPDLWFASANTRNGQAAIAICQTCPVMQQCRAWALADPTLEGIAGGLTETERDDLREGRSPEHCAKGHLWTKKNTRIIWVHGREHRRCRACTRQWEHLHRNAA